MCAQLFPLGPFRTTKTAAGRSSGRRWDAARRLQPSSLAAGKNYKHFGLQTWSLLFQRSDVAPASLCEADGALNGAISHRQIGLNLETDRQKKKKNELKSVASDLRSVETLKPHL